jgi:ATP:cob(I)alamin adenosyltransferase
MSIVTKRGDGGMTSLASGRRVPKDDTRVEAYGTLDEVVSFLGLARSVIRDKKLRAEIKKIQGDMFLLGAELAGYIPPPLMPARRRIGEPHLTRIDSIIARYEPRLGRIKGFVIPGDSLPSAALDCARALARSLERKMTALKRARKFKNAEALKYINRLSDLLWILSRHYERSEAARRT